MLSEESKLYDLSVVVTHFSNIMLQPLSTLLEILPGGVPSLLEENFRFEQGYLFAAMFEMMLNETDAAQRGGGLLRDFFAISVNLPTMVRIFPKDTLLWKLQLLKSASASANSHIGCDQWLLNKGDTESLHSALPKCEVRKFENNSQLMHESFPCVSESLALNVRLTISSALVNPVKLVSMLIKCCDDFKRKALH